MFRPLKMFDSIEDLYFQPNVLNALLPRKRAKTHPIYETLLEKNFFLEKISCCCKDLLQAVQIESAKNNLELVFKKNQDLVHTFKVTHYKDLLFENSGVAEILKKIFTELLQIKIEIKKSQCQITWDKENPFLFAKPEPVSSIHELQERFHISLYQEKPDADVVIVVDNQEILAHKLFLKRSPYFKKILEGISPSKPAINFNESGVLDSTSGFLEELFSSKTEFGSIDCDPQKIAALKRKNKLDTIIFNEAKLEVFEAMLFFCYTSRIENKDVNNPNLIIDLYKLAQFVLFEDLINYCANLMSSMISEENFLFFLYAEDTFHDQFISRLCVNFLAQNHDISKIEISHFSAEQAMVMYTWIRKHGKEDINMKCMEVIVQNLKLDTPAVELLKKLEKKDEHELMEWLIKKSGN